MSRNQVAFIVVVGVLLLLLRLCFFVVDEREVAVVTYFGDPVRIIKDPGPNFKLPDGIENVKKFDRRVLLLNMTPREVFTQDRKNIVVEPFVLWKIEDPKRFLETLTDVPRAQDRLGDLIASDLGGVLGNYPITDLLSTKPEGVKLEEVTSKVAQDVDQVASSQYGIKVLDIRIRRFAFPTQNEASIFERMRAERSRIANQYRSEGRADAQKIRAEADKKKSDILADAYRQAQIIRGKGEADATRIYAAAYGQDPQFYRFERTLEAYQKFLKEKSTYVMSSENALLQMFYKGVDEAGPHPRSGGPHHAH